jgi:hypothetical protein
MDNSIIKYLPTINIIIILSVLLLISGYKKMSIVLITISIILFIFMLIYNKMEQPKENFSMQTIPKVNTNKIQPENVYLINYKLNRTNNLNEMIENPTQNLVSWNQKLVGKANPKFEKEAPIIPKTHELDVWADHPFIVHSHINDISRTDFNQSGYNVQNRYPTNYFPRAEQYREEYKGDYRGKIYYNEDEQLRTQTLQPNVYSRNMGNEPIQGSTGITYAQQFEPTFYKEKDNRVMFTQIDSSQTIPINIERYIEKDEPTIANVYDPRFVGYGSSDRYYEEPVTGQGRYMYDDINSVRQPNYITRNKIDFITEADTYGPMNEYNAYGNVNTNEMRGIANDVFLRNSIQHRTELQDRLMRKANARMYQRRIAPIRQF